MENNMNEEDMYLGEIQKLIEEGKTFGKDFKVDNVSDGYHTFKELYDFRKIYNACLFNEWASQNKYDIHKSLKHNDGEECFGGGWFIVVAILPDGQISNHYEIKDWDLFQCPSLEKAKYPFDGHTSSDVLSRLENQIKLNTND